MNRPIAAIASLALLATLAVAAPASAHTGSITNIQSCDTGTRITAHLDENVAATASYVVTVNGTVVAQGTGPGPQELGPWSAVPGPGSASLTITFQSEQRAYWTDWYAITGCHQPPPPKPPRVYHPRASISSACEDPMFRVTLSNRASTGRVTFHITYHDEGDVRTVNRTLLPGQLVHTRYFHGDGRTLVVVTARGHLLDSDTLPPGGWWGKCPR